jgi:hypothetical protein
MLTITIFEHDSKKIDSVVSLLLTRKIRNLNYSRQISMCLEKTNEVLRPLQGLLVALNAIHNKTGTIEIKAKNLKAEDISENQDADDFSEYLKSKILNLMGKYDSIFVSDCDLDDATITVLKDKTANFLNLSARYMDYGTLIG